MTIQQTMHKRLTDRGMFESQANEVMQIVKEDMKDNMNARWSDKFEDYPPVMEAIIWSTIKLIALKWVDQNKPEAWFREMFV